MSVHWRLDLDPLVLMMEVCHLWLRHLQLLVSGNQGVKDAYCLLGVVWEQLCSNDFRLGQLDFWMLCLDLLLKCLCRFLQTRQPSSRFPKYKSVNQTQSPLWGLQRFKRLILFCRLEQGQSRNNSLVSWIEWLPFSVLMEIVREPVHLSTSVKFGLRLLGWRNY